MSSTAGDASTVVHAAARAVGLDAQDAALIRDGANVLYQLSGDVVARVGRPGTGAIAQREVEVAHWLETCKVPVIRALHGVVQPVMIENRPVTWWQLLPPHRPATPAELGAVLHNLHALSVPTELALPRFDPFAGMDSGRIDPAHILGSRDRAWVGERLADLREQYHQRDHSDAHAVLHGDAWQGNIAVPEKGPPIVLDLDKVAIGPRDSDLVAMAVDYTDFARISEAEYVAFVTAYGGYDVTRAPGYRTLADIQELRWVCFTLSKAATRPGAAEEARHRIRCLRGDLPKPWTWSAF